MSACGKVSSKSELFNLKEGKIFPHLAPHTEHLSMTTSNMPMDKKENILLREGASS